MVQVVNLRIYRWTGSFLRPPVATYGNSSSHMLDQVTANVCSWIPDTLGTAPVVAVNDTPIPGYTFTDMDFFPTVGCVDGVWVAGGTVYDVNNGINWTMNLGANTIDLVSVQCSPFLRLVFNCKIVNVPGYIWRWQYVFTCDK